MSITPSKPDEHEVRACSGECPQLKRVDLGLGHGSYHRCVASNRFASTVICEPWLWAVMETQMQLKATIDRDPDGAPMSLVPIVKMQIDLQTLDDIEPICIELEVIDE